MDWVTRTGFGAEEESQIEGVGKSAMDTNKRRAHKRAEEF